MAQEMKAQKRENIVKDNGSLTPVWPEMNTELGKAWQACAAGNMDNKQDRIPTTKPQTKS